jgi:predicted Zn-dependent protease with MMP-like domain
MSAKSTIHLYDPERELPDIASKEHDYDPSWDYEPIASPTGKELAAFREAVDEVAADMLPALEITDAIIFFVRKGGLGGDLGRYANGTSSCPAVGIDLKGIKAGCATHDLQVDDQVHATLAHEFAHARLASITNEDTHDIDGEAEERVVEEFARSWVESRTVDVGMLDKFAASCEIADDKPVPTAQ